MIATVNFGDMACYQALVLGRTQVEGGEAGVQQEQAFRPLELLRLLYRELHVRRPCKSRHPTEIASHFLEFSEMSVRGSCPQ